jgi:Na+/melibiose symporter-like transporter
MIVTCKKNIPVWWIAFAVLPWASVTFNYNVIGGAFVFSLKKFVENPAGLTFVLSMPGFIAIIMAPIAGYLSDRVWTRFGRRKPFVIAGSVTMISAFVLMPLVPNVWALIACYILYHCGDAVSSPRDPLKQEIVPPHERGRAAGLMSWCQNIATLVFYVSILGRFDDITYFSGIPIDGEMIIYWSAALLLGCMVLLITLGIKEFDQRSELRGERLSINNFVSALLDRELWPVYLLVLSYCLLNFYSGFGPFLSTLLYTDQWGYSKQEMGLNIAIGGVANIFIIGGLIFVADRLPRLASFRCLMYLSLAWNAFYFFYVNYLLPDGRPTLVEIILFGEVLSIISTLLGLLYFPLIFDYVTRNKMGTFSAGMQIVTRGAQLFTMNGVGIFVWAWASLFHPPAGEMVRVTLSQQSSGPEIEKLMMRDPQIPTQKAEIISVTEWQADGSRNNERVAWEIRRSNKNSEGIAEEKRLLEGKLARLMTQQKIEENVRDQTKASNISQFQETESVKRRIHELEGSLIDRSEHFKSDVVRQIGQRLIAEGSQIRSVQEHPTLIVTAPVSKRIEGIDLDKISQTMRAHFPAVIDVIAMKLFDGYGIAIAAKKAEDTDAAVQANNLIHLFESCLEGAAVQKDSIGNTSISMRMSTTLQMELQTLEFPVSDYRSPVSRVTDGFTEWLIGRGSRNSKLLAIERSLRQPDKIPFVRVTAALEKRSLSVLALMEDIETPSSSQAQIRVRLNSLIGSDAAIVAKAEYLYNQVEVAAAAQKITIARPVIAASYVPLRYDYMSGYLWVFAVGIIGIALTYVFGRLERRGVIRKRGVEEAASATA